LNGLGILYEGMADSSRSRVAIGFPKNHETFLKMFKVRFLGVQSLIQHPSICYGAFF
jgi:hypothetical protein